MNRAEAVRKAAERLTVAGIAEASLDAKYLFYHVTGLSQMDLLLYGSEAMEQTQEKAYMALVNRRAEHEPLQYLTGEQEFMGLSFKVSPAVLIPRQDTECLVEEVMKYAAGRKLLDVCTGSGCIAISLAKLAQAAAVTASDLSEQALAIAQQNVTALEADVTLLQGDLFAPVEGRFDIIVSNPPYICSEEVTRLMPEVRDHEPKMALDGDADGLKFYRRITEQAPEYLTPGGMLFFEIGCEQAEAVSALMREHGFGDIRVKKDYAGLDRVVYGKLAICVADTTNKS